MEDITPIEFNWLACGYFQHLWLKELDSLGYSPTHVTNCRYALRLYYGFMEAEGIPVLSAATRQTWRGFATYLFNRRLSKVTIAHIQSSLRGFYLWLRRENIIPQNPFWELPSPKLDKRLPRFLSVREANQLVESPDLSSPEGIRDRAMLELLYASGIRASELVGLNLDRINLDAREAYVIGKGSKERLVLFGQPAAQALRTYLRIARPMLLNGIPTSAVFVNSHSRRISIWGVDKVVGYYGKILGKRVYPHLLRHTFATHLLNGAADLRVVQELLGHELLATTQIYTHVTIPQAKKAYFACHPLAQEEAKNV